MFTVHLHFPGLATMLFYYLFRKDNLKEWRDNYISQIEAALHKAVSNLYR